MAKKLNKKLVFVVGAATISLGALLGFGIMWRMDTDRFIRTGDKLSAEGDFRKAADAYGRAVNKKQNNIAYLEKFDGAILKIVPETQNEANERYQQHISSLQLLARADRDNVKRWRDYFEAITEQCDGLSSTGAWKNLADRCSESLNTVRPGGTEELVIKAFRGFAGAKRLDSLDDPQRVKVVEDLTLAAACKDLTPVERDRVLGSLARIAVDGYARARGAGRADQLDSAKAAADKALADAVAACPEGVITAIAVLDRAIVDADGSLSSPEVATAAKALAAKALASGQPMTILASVNVLVRAGETGVLESRALLAAFIEKNPQQLLHRRVLASMLRFGESEKALAEIDAILKAERPSVGLVAASFEGNRADAAIVRFNILYDQVENGAADQRAEGIAKLVAAREELAKSLEGAPDESPLLRVDGKILTAKRDYANASVKFNEVFKKGSEVDLELYILAAFANLELGEVGRALDLLNGGLNLSPGNPQLLRMRATLEVRTGRVRDALATVAALKERLPNDPQVAELEQRILAIREADPVSQTAGNDTGAVDAFARIQSLMQAKDFDGARRAVEEMRKAAEATNPGAPNLVVERFAIAIEVEAGQIDKARQMIQAALQQFPNDSAMQRFNALFASEDPVERIVILTESTVEEQPLRTIVTYLRLLQSALAVRETATRETRLGQANAANTTKAAERLEQGVKEWRAKAEAADRAHPILVEADFRDAIERKDYSAATAIMQLAKESKRDPSQSVLLESQLLAAQGKMREATAVLENALQTGIDNSVVYRALGSVLEQAGNIEGAQRQYEEAYKRRPGDMQTVRQLVGALVRNGNAQRALEVLRDARQLAGLDEEIADVWLGLEGQLGDRRLAMRLRENQYRIAPQDPRNALALANMLAVSSPDRVDVLNERGQEAYSEQQWQQLEDSVRLAALERARSEWRKRAEDIYISTLKREPGNLDVANSFSQMLRVLGRRDDAAKALADATAAAGEQAGWRGYIMLGGLLLQLDRIADAEAAFAEAIKRENPTERDATKSVVDLAFNNERFDLALRYLEPLAKDSTDKQLKVRFAEILLRAGRSSDARTAFDTAVAGLTRDVGTEMLDGAIAMKLGDDLRAAGDIAKAQAAYELSLTPYSRAKALAPFAPQPFIQDAMAKRKLFELGASARGPEALAAADRAVALGGALLAASAIRSEVLLALGDVTGAAAELERFLRISPTSIEARRRLTEIHERSGRVDRAEDSIRTAIGLMPGDPAWNAALGDLLVRQGRFAEAADSFERADILQPIDSIFFRELNARIRAKDYRGAIDASRRRSDLVRSSPTARTYVGVALIGGNERSEGLKTLGETYQEARKQFEAGDATSLMQWYEAISLLFTPETLTDAEGLVRQFSAGSIDPLGLSFLADLCMGNPSAGPAKALEYLAPIESTDFKSMPMLGAQLLDRLGTILYIDNKCERAIGCFERALALTPNADGVLNNYAYLCGACLKDAKKGLPSARLAVQLNPARSEYLDTLGFLLVTDAQYTEALEILKRAEALANSAAVQLHLAQAYNGLNRKSDAIGALENASKLNPDPQIKASMDELAKALK